MTSAVFIAIAALALPACGQEAGTFSSGSDFSIASALGQLPELKESDRLEIRIGDLEAASKSQGLTRPASADDPNAMSAWLGPLTAGPRGPESELYVPMPVGLGTQTGLAAGVAEEIGWSIRDVDTFAEVAMGLESFLVETGNFGPETFPKTLSENDGIVSAGSGEDFKFDLKNNTVARRTGQPLRMATAEGRIAASPSTPLIKAWKNGLKDSLADDAALMSVATGLDDHDVMSAILIKGNFAGLTNMTPARKAELGKLASGFDCVGIGWAVHEDKASMVVVYHFADEASADKNLSTLEGIWRDGVSVDARKPIAEMVKVEDVGAESENVVISLSRIDDVKLSLLYNMLSQRDLPFTNGGN